MLSAISNPQNLLSITRYRLVGSVISINLNTPYSYILFIR
jgi:hypothetical protein